VSTIEDLIQLRGSPAWLVGALIVMAMSMIGIPPTGGFFGKWYIILGAIEAENYLAIGAVLGATLLTMAYFIKIFERLFRDRSPGTDSHAIEGAFPLKGSLVGVSVMVIVLGLLSDPIVRFLIETTIPPGF